MRDARREAGHYITITIAPNSQTCFTLDVFLTIDLDYTYSQVPVYRSNKYLVNMGKTEFSETLLKGPLFFCGVAGYYSLRTAIIVM